MSQGINPSMPGTPESTRAIPPVVFLDHDPSVAPTLGHQGQIAIVNGSTSTFQKQDDGVSINWTPFGSIGPIMGIPNTVAYFDPAGLLSSDIEFAYFLSVQNILQLGSTNAVASPGGSPALVIGSNNVINAINSSVLAGNSITIGTNCGGSGLFGVGHNISGANANVMIVAGIGVTIVNSPGLALFGQNHVITDGDFSLVGGSDHIITSFINVFLAGEGQEATREAQALVGKFADANAKTMFAVGTGTSNVAKKSSLAVEDTGLVRREVGGLREKSRLDANAVVTVDAEADFIVLLNQGMPQTAQLPAGVDGMSYFIKDASGVAGHTIQKTGADVFEGGAPNYITGSPYSSVHLHFRGGVWYVISVA